MSFWKNLFGGKTRTQARPAAVTPKKNHDRQAVSSETTHNPSPPRTVDPKKCASCETTTLTLDEFCVEARAMGFEVDRRTGKGNFVVSGAFLGVGSLDEHRRKQQRLFDAIEERRAYRCRACGKKHCTSCLMKTERNPITKGPRCPSCTQGPHDIV